MNATRRWLIVTLSLLVASTGSWFGGTAGGSLPSTPISWLAAGDSYSSGEGLPHSTGPCARADETRSHSWASAAQDILQSSNSSVSMSTPVLAACTGATTSEMLDANDPLGTPEWTPSMGRFDLLTFTFGGDDIGFAPILEQCLGLSRLVSAGANAISFAADIGYYTSPLPSDAGHTCPAQRLLSARIASFGATYQNFLVRVAHQVVAPGGNIVVLGYPDLVELPKFWQWWEQKVGSCWGIGTADAAELRGLAGQLNATIGAAVAAVNRQAPDGVHMTFVDVNSANGGSSTSDLHLFEPAEGPRHNLCGSQPWMNGGSPIDYGTGSFHPKQEGLDAEGALAAAAIAKLEWCHIAPSWQAVKSPVSGGASMSGISCSSVTFCMAVGTVPGNEPTSSQGNLFSLAAYTWNGQTWSAIDSPESAINTGTTNGYLEGVACASSNACLAYGTGFSPASSEYPIGILETAVVFWNGTSWTDTNFPNHLDQISGLNCPATNWCVAIDVPGQDVASGGLVSAAVWNGTAWSITPISGLSAPGTTQFAVSCASTNFCMATADLDGVQMGSADQPTQQNVSYAWDGSQWHEVAWPTSSVAVGPISCPSSTLCVQLATPNASTPRYGRGDVEFLWNGGVWKESAMPLPDTLLATSLSCVSVAFCVAVGSPWAASPTSVGGTPSSVQATSDVRTDSTWGPTLWVANDPNESLAGVSCIAQTCMAVGTVTATLRAGHT